MKAGKVAVLCCAVLLGSAGHSVGAADWNPLPDTGQTKCYDVAGNEIACPAEGEPLYGQDAQYHGPAPSYTDNGDGTVTDNNTGLIWQQNTADINNDGHINSNFYPAGDRTSWQNAIDYCESLSFAGSSDWRLPGVTELDSIVDYSRNYSAINPIFQCVSSYYSGFEYWSATTSVVNNYSDHVWVTSFSEGYDRWVEKTFPEYVRCVRGEKTARGSYTDNGDTVTDLTTGLTWQKETADIDRNGVISADDEVAWQDALSYCEELTLAGKSDWRLPNIRELKSLVDVSTDIPAINPVFQCEIQPYWTATTATLASSSAFTVHFGGGNNPSINKTFQSFVRCVRGGLSDPSGYVGHLQQTPQAGPAGTTFTQSGTGFTLNSTVTLHFRNPLGEELTPLQLPTDTNGAFSTTYTAPTDKPPGTYTWWAVDDATGGLSEVLGYLITKEGETESGLTTNDSVGSNLGPIHQNLGFGELTSEGNFDPNKETFVIVHGRNPENTTALPGWVKEMGIAIRNSQDSPAKGSNVLYWNWQDEAMHAYGVGVDDSSCNDLMGVPFDKTENSGNYLAAALLKALPKSYNKNIHFIGHSLGTLVSTYAAKYAKKYALPFADHITHLVFLDSPCWGNGSIPGGRFLHDNKNTIFFDNYISDVGRSYKVADVNVWLTKARDWGVIDAHSYAYYWYISSVRNFSNNILGDPSPPTSTMPWGFYWWKKSNQTDAKSNYKQMLTKPAYSLTVLSNVERIIAGHIYGVVDESVELLNQIAEYAEWTGKIVTILAATTFNTAIDAVDYVTDMGTHAFYNSLGYLTLSHSSTGMLSMPMNIPAGANALAFGVEFLYGNSDSMLEVFLNDQLVYHTTGDQALGEGLQLIPWINVEQFAGQSVSVTLRLSNPEDGAKGKIRIDDIIVAKIKKAGSFPWNMFLPAITSGLH